MDKQIEHLAKLHDSGGVVAVVQYLRDNLVPHEISIQTFNGSGSAAKVNKSEWIAKAAPNEFREHYDDLVERRQTGLSQTRLRAYSIKLK